MMAASDSGPRDDPGTAPRAETDEPGEAAESSRTGSGEAQGSRSAEAAGDPADGGPEQGPDDVDMTGDGSRRPENADDRTPARSLTDALTSERRRESGRTLGDGLDALVEALQRLRIGSTINLSGGNLFLGDVNARDVVGRNASTIGRSDGAVEETTRSGSFAIEELHRTAATWVQPDCYAAAAARLDVCSLVVLRGVPGSGRTAIAQHLLHAEYGAGVCLLSPDCDLAKLDVGALTPKTGYVLALVTGHSSPLRAWYLTELGLRLTKAGCRLVVVVDETYRLEDDAPEHVVAVEAVDHASVLVAHLSYELCGAMDPQVRALLADDRLRELTNEAGRSEGLRGVVRLAGELAAVVRGTRTIDSVEHEVRQRSEADLRDWFLSDLDTDVRAFAVALAIFQDLPYADVAAVAHELEALLAPDRPDAQDGDRRRPLGRRRGELLEACQAETFRAMTHSGYGLVQVQAVHYCRTSYPPLVLELFWQEYDHAHAALLAWLADLGRRRNRRIRIGAAAAVGLLATWSFRLVLDTVLVHWADQPQWTAHEAAATALAVPARTTAYEPVIRNLLRDWAGVDTRPGRRLVAARSWGATVGTHEPAEALAQLGTLASRTANDMPLLQTIMDSTTELFVASERERIDQVPEALLSWWDNDRTARGTAAACFLQIADTARARAVPDAQTWPALLSLGPTDERCRALVGDLLHRTLNIAPLSKLALEILRDWAAEAEADSRLRLPLADMLIRATRTTSDMQRLRYHLNRWRTGRDPVLQTVAVIVQELTERRGNLL